MVVKRPLRGITAHVRPVAFRPLNFHRPSAVAATPYWESPAGALNPNLAIGPCVRVAWGELPHLITLAYWRTQMYLLFAAPWFLPSVD